MIKDKDMWEECARDCPGMNKGRVWTFEEIELNRHEYDANFPLEKEEFEKLPSKEN